tara:strand:+ start:1473 stop:1640 length:168 start_codon:yes stop_codon:yes gene_type:complete
MPSYGEKQIPAGVVRNIAKPILSSRTMKSKNGTIMPAMTIDNCTYKGNAALNANR